MKKKIQILLLALILGALGNYAFADEEHPSEGEAPQISLLTCGPTDDYVFYLYGHTALRVQDGDKDLVYNYGYFSPDQKHFILNFILGKPMYSVGVTTFQQFLYEYEVQGRSVVEQHLRLMPDEARNLVEMLEWNILPENRDYQYNFYFDNCATRPRDLIEKYTGGLEYDLQVEKVFTFREAIRSHSHTASWYTTGADCCLGIKSDRPMSIKEAAFLPSLLEQEFDLATRKKDGERLVIEKIEWLPQTKEIGIGFWGKFNFPIWTFILLGFIYFGLFMMSCSGSKKWPLNLLRRILYSVLLGCGVIVWFLAFFSEHPHTFPNANLLLFHPLYAILLFTMGKERYNRTNNWLYFINFVAILVYLGLGYKQVLPIGVPFLAIIMAADQFLHLRKGMISAK